MYLEAVDRARRGGRAGFARETDSPSAQEETRVKIFAHRANIQGRSDRENDPEQIEACLARGLGVEVDLHQRDGRFFFGHDTPDYEVELERFDVAGVIFHLKTPQVPTLRSADAFALERDAYAFTLRGYLWTNYETPISARSIVCAPELVGAPESLDAFVARASGASGICTDFPARVAELLEERGACPEPAPCA